MNCYSSPPSYRILRDLIRDFKAKIVKLSKNPKVKYSNIKEWVNEAKRIVNELEEDLKSFKENDTICYDEFYTRIMHVAKILDRIENTIKPIQLN